MDSSRQIEDEAAAWMVRRDGEDWSSEDQAQLQAWLDSAIAHRVAFLRLEAAWEEALRLRALGAGKEEGIVPPPGEWRVSPFFERRSRSDKTPDTDRKGSLRFKRYGAIAASCVLAIALGLFGHSVLRGSHYATPIGGIRNVALADGSHITLNTDTSLRARISDNERHIELDRGEAFFEVSKDTARPFIVYAGDKRIMAVGTQFSVRRVDDEVKVVVTEGLVKLAAADAFTTDFPQMTSESVVGPAASDGTDSATYLRAGAVAKTLKTRVLVSEDAAANAEKLLTWRQGYIFFDSMPLAEAVAEFNRYTTRKIVIQDPGVAAIRISGKFGSANAEAFVRVLRDGFGVDVQSTDERILLTRLADSRLPAAD